MRITATTRFPHPVLSADTGDYTTGDFRVDFTVVEHRTTGALALTHQIDLSEPHVTDLIEHGLASVGCFVRCEDTYYNELRRLSWQTGRSDFNPGVLLNRVTLRPVVWLERPVPEWNPGTIHEEFDPPVALDAGDVIAYGAESVISVGQAKFTPIESIFELQKLEDSPDGQVVVDPSGDRIAIRVSSRLFDAMSLLRSEAKGFAILMNGVYLPAVMEVLDLLRSEPEQYEAFRWYEPFRARCDAKGVVPGADASLYENAQRLLDRPPQHLIPLAEIE